MTSLYLFEDLFTQPDKEEEPEPAAKKCKVSTSTPLLTEIKEFRDRRDTNERPHSFLEVK